MEQIFIKGEEDYTKLFHEFCVRKGVNHVVGFSGGADDSIAGIELEDALQEKYKAYHHSLHQRIIEDVLKPLQGCRVAVLTGGTRWGIPAVATQVAGSMGFKTIGVTPIAGVQHALSSEELDLQFIVEPLFGDGHWGDEGSLWTSLVDAVVVIGGGAGTLTECAHLMKINEALVKKGHSTKYMIPIHGTGGIAEQLPHLWAKPNIRDVSMPRERVSTGAHAAELLLKHVPFEYSV
jgi:hypothetical protein